MFESMSTTPFVPILTVLAEVGGPFIWIVRRPEDGGVGPCLCDSMGWDESYPLSKGLFQKFADWAVTFDDASRVVGYTNDLEDDWDWIAFHARGMQLSRWLKEEVGEAYRVVYVKYGADPNYQIDERIEFLADGNICALPPLRNSYFSAPPRFCKHIVSGGQTGADRGALDFAIEHGYTHGGWATSGRKAEDGTVPLKYQLTALAEGGYRQRTRRNVEDSDGTLIVNIGEVDGGTLATQTFAEQMRKPYLVVQLDLGTIEEIAARVFGWLRQNVIDTLNVAGPRESKRPGIYSLTVKLLQAVDDANRSSSGAEG
jgi:hypothetical protein